MPLQTYLYLEVKPGHRVFHAISGSGGQGDLWQHEPEQVLRDVHDEKVTMEAAREQYGVVIDPQNFIIDWQQTYRLRQSRRANESRTALG